MPGGAHVRGRIWGSVSNSVRREPGHMKQWEDMISLCLHQVLINSTNLSIHNYFKFSRKKKKNEAACLIELISVSTNLMTEFSGKCLSIMFCKYNS